MLDVARTRLPGAELVQGDALALPFPDDCFDRVVTGHFYGHLDEAQRTRFLAESRRVAPELVVVDASRTHSDVDKQWAPRSSATGRAGRSTSAGSLPRSFSQSSAAVTCCSPATGSSWSAHRGERRPRARRPPAPQPQLPPVPRGGVPDRPAACPRRSCRPARVPLRPRSGPRRGGDRPPLAGTRRANPSSLARARRGGVLRALLLRLCHTLLPRAEPERPRRPSRHDRRGGALRSVARSRARAARASADRHRRPRTGAAASRDRAAHATRWARASSCESAVAIPLPHPSGASGWLNERTNRARLGKALTHVRRELAALDVGARPAHGCHRIARMRSDPFSTRPGRSSRGFFMRFFLIALVVFAAINLVYALLVSAISSRRTTEPPSSSGSSASRRRSSARHGSRARSSTPCRTLATAPSTRRSARSSPASPPRSSRCCSPACSPVSGSPAASCSWSSLVCS